MAKQYRHRRSSNPATVFPTLEPGELAVNTANRQIAMGDAASGVVGAPLPVIPIRYFDARASYATNDMVVQSGNIWKANAAVPPGAFNGTQWTQVGGGGSGGGIPEAPTDGQLYSRKGQDASWQVSPSGGGGGSAGSITVTPGGGLSATDVQAALIELDNEKVAKAGDTMAGGLTISNTGPLLTFNKAASGQQSILWSKTGNVNRWAMVTSNSTAESANAGSDFVLNRYNDAGTFVDSPIWFSRLDGRVTMSNNVGIGSVLPDTALAINKVQTGAASTYGVRSYGTIASDVTGSSALFHSIATTTAATFTCGTINHFAAVQGAFGAGSTVTNQYGFYVHPSLIGATNNYGYHGNIPAGTGRWNLYMGGTANNYMAGALALGITTSYTERTLGINKNITGGTTAYGIVNNGTIQSDVTGYGVYNRSVAATQAAAFNLSNLLHYQAAQGAIGAGSSVSTQVGFVADSSLAGGTANIGFQGLLPAGANNWNLYASGAASNHMAGALAIGSATQYVDRAVGINKNITGAASAYGVVANSLIINDVTAAEYFHTTANTQAASFTLGSLTHYATSQSAFGAGSTVNNQFGFVAGSSLSGAVNNYGFWSGLAAGASNWNFYASGTARNYMNGALSIGTAADPGTSGLLVNGNATIGSTAAATVNLFVNRPVTGGASASLVRGETTIQADVTTLARGFLSVLNTAAAAFTLAELNHFEAFQNTIGAGSTVGTQRGFYVPASMVGATNNYAFLGDIPLGTNRWNFYGKGTARNFMQGALSIGGTTDPGTGGLYVNGAATFATTPTAPTPTAGDNSTKMATTAFVTSALSNTAPMYVADTAPAGAPDKSLWWESDTGLLYLKYNDGNTSQWVTAAPQPDLSTYAVKADITATAADGLQINGGMEVDQPNAGAVVNIPSGTVVKKLIDGYSFTKTGTSVLDVQQIASTIPGYVKSLRLKCTTAQPAMGSDLIDLYHLIEGFRISKLGWGTSAAQPLTVGFWVKASVTGNFFMSIYNSDVSTVADPLDVTAVTTANVAQWVTCRFAAKTTGVWKTDNGLGMQLLLRFASAGMNIVSAVNNTFEITGLVVLPGTVAPTAAQSPLLMRPYADELRLCKRYYHQIVQPEQISINGGSLAGANEVIMFEREVEMRSAPTTTFIGSWTVMNGSGLQPYSSKAKTWGILMSVTANGGFGCYPTNTGDGIKFDARL